MRNQLRFPLLMEVEETLLFPLREMALWSTSEALVTVKLPEPVITMVEPPEMLAELPVMVELFVVMAVPEKLSALVIVAVELFKPKEPPEGVSELPVRVVPVNELVVFVRLMGFVLVTVELA